MFFLFNNLHGAIFGTNTCPADFQPDWVHKFPNRSNPYPIKGMCGAEKIEVLKKIFMLDFI
jgi:hypothetical protein